MAGGQAVAEVVGTGPQVNGYEDASGNCHVPASRRGTPAKLTHVELLREEHRKLQQRFVSLQETLAKESKSPDSLGSCLSRVVRSLWKSSQFSDITIQLNSQTLPGHRIVFACRGKWFRNQNDLSSVSAIDLSNLSNRVGHALVMWMYTDELDLASQNMDFVIEMMRSSHLYHLPDIKQHCGARAVSDISVKNCVDILVLADDVEQEDLQQYAMGFIVSHWSEIQMADLEKVPANLLYQLIKTKTNYPLHEAVQMLREDVVFLFLLEKDSQLPTILDELDENSNTAIQIALAQQHVMLADILVEHGANLNSANRQGVPILNQAIDNKDEFTANYLVKKGANIHLQDRTGRSALHIAAARNLPDLVKLILKSGADINLCDNEMNTALHEAIQSNSLDTTHSLLDYEGILIDARNAHGHSPLWLALNSNNIELASVLVQRGCSINIIDANGNAMIHDTILNGMHPAALFLIEHGCTIDATNSDSCTPLHLAASIGAVDVVENLLHHNACINAQNARHETPLMLAVSQNQEPVINTLLQCDGIEMELTSSEGRTALGICIVANVDENVFLHLVKHNADLEAQLPNGDRLLHDSIRKGRVAVARLLIQHGADLESTTTDDDTPLTSDIAEILCSKGANVNRSTSSRGTPLHEALKSRQEEIASILVRHECDVDMADSSSGLTALHKAILDQDEFAALFLMRHEANVNAANNPEKATPLHMACSIGFAVMPLITELLRNRADINAQDVNNKTPIHRCLYNEHTEVASKLLLHPKLQPNIRDNTDQTIFGLALATEQYTICTQLLQQYPAAIEERDGAGMTYLHTALTSRKLDVVDVLIKLGADVNAFVQDPSQRSALAVAVEHGLEEHAIKLLRAGAAIDVTDTLSGWSVAHIAASIGCSQVLDELIKAGADLDLQDFQGDTVLHAALRAGHEDIAQRLVSDDVDIDVGALNDAGETPLHTLCKFPKSNSVELLTIMFKKSRKLVNTRDAEGSTPLVIAFKQNTPGCRRLCIALVKNGSQINIENYDGESCFTLGKGNNDFLLTLLRELPREQSWAEGDKCQECRIKFGTRTRKHHCRHCGRLLCKKCSSKSTPIIKYSLEKPVRVCDICYDVLSGLAAPP